MPRKAPVYYSLVIMVFIMNASAWAGTATLSWDPNTETDLAGYKAYYGIASASYTQSIDVGNVLTYTINNLAEGVTYFFVVTAYNTSGNESGFSNEGSKTIPDTASPILSAIVASSITSTGAIITWTTNEASTSQVDYGTTTAYGSSSSLNSTLLISHSRTLSGLAPSTTYHYRVRSTDATGNTATSGDNTFTTSAAPDTTPPTISGVTASNISSTGAIITWTTNEASTSQVDYGTTTAYGSSSPLDSTLLTSHSRTLSGLAPSTTYHFRVRSTDAAGNTATSGDNTFITSAAPDTTPPTISGVTASNITTTSAIITWSTNEASTSQVDYGTTTAYGSSSPLDSTLLTSHSRTLSGLTASTTYHFRVRSTDAVGNTATSGDNTFTTSATPDTTPPIISGVTASNISSTGATITWATNEASSSQIQYGTTTSYGSSSTLNSTLVTSHSITLSNLIASTTYHYRVISTDAVGNTATSGDNTFTTSATPDTTPPMDVSEFNAEPKIRAVQLTWTNPPDPDFMGVRIRFRTDGSFPANSQDGELVGDFTGQPLDKGKYVHTGLSKGTTYYYSAFSYDAYGNYSHTVFAQATPLDDISTSDNGNSSPGFGCGRLQDISGGGRGPTAGQAALNFAVFAVLFLLIKRYQKKRPSAESEWAL